MFKDIYRHPVLISCIFISSTKKAHDAQIKRHDNKAFLLVKQLNDCIYDLTNIKRLAIYGKGLDVPMRTNDGDTSILSKGWVYLILLVVVTIVFCGIFIYITVYDAQDQMLFTYAALIYAVFILYLMIVTSAYYLKIREPAEIMTEVQKLRSTISDAFRRPRW